MAKERPALLGMCEISKDLRATLQKSGIRSIRQGRQTVAALKDLAISTIAIRRAHRIRIEDAEHFDYLYHYTTIGTFDTLFPVPVDKEKTASKPEPPGTASKSKVARTASKPEPAKSASKSEPKGPWLVLSPTELLNDPNEGTHFFENLLRSKEAKIEPLATAVFDYRRNMRIELGLTDANTLVFTASLCIDRDNLNLWRFYGEAKGVSFGIHISKFDRENEEGIGDDSDNGPDKLYRVKYGDREVATALNHALPALKQLNRIYCGPGLAAPLREHISKTVIAILNTVAYLFKTDSYSAEKECRLLRIQGVTDARIGKRARTIGRFIRVESNIELIHPSDPAPPILTLGPQFDGINPERGQMWALDRISVALAPERSPVVKLSAMKHRI